MATVTTSDIKLSALPPVSGQAGLRGVIASEFTKIRSVRSTYWTIAALVIVGVGIAALVGFGIANNIHNQPWNKAGTDGTQSILTPFLFIGQLIIAVIGAMVITSEYSTGMIRTSLTAMPRRGVVFAAKALVFGLVALVIGLITSFASFFLGQAIMSSDHINASLGQPGVLRAVIGGALFLTACGLLSFGIGMMLRHTAGAITASIGLLFVLTVLVQFLPQSWQDDVDKWIPALAGSQVWAVKASTDGAPMFSAWGGFAVLAGYAAVALIGGFITFRGRDA